MTQVMSCISVKKLNIDNSYLCMYAASKTSRVGWKQVHVWGLRLGAADLPALTLWHIALLHFHTDHIISCQIREALLTL